LHFADFASWIPAANLGGDLEGEVPKKLEAFIKLAKISAHVQAKETGRETVRLYKEPVYRRYRELYQQVRRNPATSVFRIKLCTKSDDIMQKVSYVKFNASIN
jgi:hypothetical protein